MADISTEELTPSCSSSALVPLINTAVQVHEPLSRTSLIFPMICVPRLSSLASLELQSPIQLHDLKKKLRPKSHYRKNRFKATAIFEPIPEDEVWVFRSVHDVTTVDKMAVKITPRNKDRHLCEGVSLNDLQFVESLINAGVSPNCFDSHKRTPLHIGVSKGYCEMVELLLKKGANPNIKDGLGNSCLHLAACTNNVEITLILIKGGASVHAVDVRGRNPIQIAQSKLKILQQCPDGLIKSKVEQVIDMLLMYLQMGHEHGNSSEESALLSSFQNKLQITESPELIACEIDNLSKILNQMETLSL